VLSTRWRKVLRDIWGFKGRTVLVILSIATSVLAIGVIGSSQIILSRDMHAAWNAVSPPSTTLFIDLFDEELLWTLERLPQIETADARRDSVVRFKRSSPAGDPIGDWRRLQLFAYPDYENIRIFKLRPEAGTYPPPEQEILLERASLEWMGVQVGEEIIVEAANGKERRLRVAGTVHDITQTAASWTGMASGYISRHTLPWLGITSGFDNLNLVVADHPYDEAHIRTVAQVIENKVEKGGRTVYYTWIETPGKHPADNDIKPILLILGALGILAMLMSGFLVVNTFQALLGQQVRQIGMMKAIGGRFVQITGLYLGMVVVFSLLALALAVPLGAVGAQALSRFIAQLVNFDLPPFRLPIQVLAIQAAVGLGIPILGSLFPIISGARVTAREAMSDYGLSNGHFGQGLLDRILERVRGVSRPVLLSLRNTFRRKARLLLTLVTLILGGAIFVAVFSLHASLMATLDGMMRYVNYDTLVSFSRDYRTRQIEQEALTVPGVVTAETWRFYSARRLRPDGTSSESINIRAPRADSALVRPSLEAGRWLLPDDENAIVLNTIVLRDEPDIQVGDKIILKMDDEKISWQVVGIMSGTPPFPMAYVNYSYLSQVVGGVGRAGVVFVITEQHDPATQHKAAAALEAHYEEIGMRVSNTQTSSTERLQLESQFNTLVAFLLAMAVLLAVVGAIGLAGTMSLNVLERTREIGVMRAIGATSGAVRQIVVVEGVLIGLISWMVASMLALPLGRLLSNMVGFSIMEIPLAYTYSSSGLAIWLATVILLSTLASLWPARSACHVSVREVLAYE
jgi:putative ABC transport system permease protein